MKKTPVCSRHAYGGSAVCWMYGRRIQERYPSIPLGLIQAHVGGTAIEPWSPPAALATCGIKPAFHRAQAGVSCPPYCNSSSLFNGMIAPLLNYSIHHVVWCEFQLPTFVSLCVRLPLPLPPSLRKRTCRRTVESLVRCT